MNLGFIRGKDTFEVFFGAKAGLPQYNNVSWHKQASNLRHSRGMLLRGTFDLVFMGKSVWPRLWKISVRVCKIFFGGVSN